MYKKTGFTIVELMVAITVIAIITSISVVSLSSVRKRAADTARLSGLRDLQLAIEGYKSINGKYPLAGTGTVYVQGLEPNFITKLPQDKPQNTTNGFKYTVSLDQKSYCVGVKNNVTKNTTQPELVDGANSWKACKGTTPYPAW
jgi:prepilin-type N-terminal cleavage/methylation domain-containing protein